MTRLVWLALIVFLSACEGRAPSVSDPYDPAKMDLKPKPARVTSTAGDGALCRGGRAVDDGDAEAARSGARQGDPARHGRTRSSRSRPG